MGRRRTLGRSLTLAVLIALALVLTACGRGRLELVSLNYRAIDPPAPRATDVPLHECYWWADDDGNVRVAMKYVRRRLFLPTLDFNLSLVLEKPPRGHARNYKLNRRTMRARVRMGPWQTRFNSTTGIAAVYRESGDRLRGSLRLLTTRVAARLLGGWGKPTRYLLQGAFVATRDPRRGRAILEITESDGWERGKPPAKRAIRRQAEPDAKRDAASPSTSPKTP